MDLAAYGQGVAVIIVLLLYLAVVGVHLGAAIEDLAVSGQEVIAERALTLLVQPVLIIIVFEVIQATIAHQGLVLPGTQAVALIGVTMGPGSINLILAV